MKHVISMHNTGVTRTRITIAANEVRVKFPGNSVTREYWHADAIRERARIRLAAMKLGALVDSPVTLRGRFVEGADGRGLRVSLFNRRSKWMAHYYISPDLEITEEFA